MILNPFNIPEIRGRLALFVSVTTALSCVRVSKAFSKDFIYPIWCTIDFTTQTAFENLAPSVVAKNGRYIRVVKGVENSNQLNLLLNIDLNNNKLTEVHLSSPINYYHDLIRRNQNTLVKYEINNSRDSRVASLFVYLDSLTSMIGRSQSSKLTTLIVRWLTLTVSTFTSALRCCPSLVSIDIWGTTFIPNSGTDDFQHEGVTYLQSMMSDMLIPVDRPILMHFPNLITWSTYPDMPDSLEIAKNIIQIWCPLLKKVYTRATSENLITMINLVFFNLTALSFDYNNMTPDLILAIVHRPKWETIRVFHESDNIDEADQVFSLPDHFQATFWMIQMIPRFCLNLKEFDMIQHVMDMDDVEEGQWACKNLKDLKVRIKGLDTKEKIDKTIDMYRNEKRLMLSSGDKRETLLDDSIEARVARHLLQFEKLETIWIGTKTWRVKRMDFT